MTLRAIFGLGLMLCFIEAFLGSAILRFACFVVNLLLGGSIERKPRGVARQKLLDELAAYERAKNAGKILSDELPYVETNPYAIPAAAPSQAVMKPELREQPLPVPTPGKAFAICIAASVIHFCLRCCVHVAMSLFASPNSQQNNQFFQSTLDQLMVNVSLTTFVGIFILAAILKHHLPTKLWIAFSISAIYHVILLGLIFLVFGLIN